MKRREYRSRIMIIRDILESISSNRPAKISTIVRDANVPYDRLVKILESMLQNGLLDKTDDSYVLTEQGHRLLEEINEVEKLARAFGIKI